MLLLHGHQLDWLSGRLWWISRFLVRHIWKHLEKIGFKDPTKAGKNYKVSKRIEKRLSKWAIKKNTMVLAGHTHRPIYPSVGNGLYFNDGSCVHPNGITCLEIENGKISLVKWVYGLEGKKEPLIKSNHFWTSLSYLNFASSFSPSAEKNTFKSNSSLITLGLPITSKLSLITSSK